MGVIKYRSSTGGLDEYTPPYRGCPLVTLLEETPWTYFKPLSPCFQVLGDRTSARTHEGGKSAILLLTATYEVHYLPFLGATSLIPSTHAPHRTFHVMGTIGNVPYTLQQHPLAVPFLGRFYPLKMTHSSAHQQLHHAPRHLKTIQHPPGAPLTRLTSTHPIIFTR
jgi:hypothetical protein